MHMKPEWLREIESWAERRNEVSEVWLFGSRAKGSARDDSDIDLALILPPENWAFANYVAFGDKWQHSLASALGKHVSLEAINGPELVEKVLIWRRGSSP